MANQSLSLENKKKLCEGGFILILALAGFLLISLLSFHHHAINYSNVENAGGKLGYVLAEYGYFLFGMSIYILPISMVYLAWMTLHRYQNLKAYQQSTIIMKTIGFVFVLLSSCGLQSLKFTSLDAHLYQEGGLIGQTVMLSLTQAINVSGSFLLLVALFLVGITWLTGFSWIKCLEYIGLVCMKIFMFLTRQSSLIIHKMKHFSLPKWSLKPSPKTVFIPKKNKSLSSLKVDTSKPAIEPVTETPKKHKSVTSKLSIQLLDKGKASKPLGGYSAQELEHLSREVEQNLLDFGIQADVVAVHPGPVITRFELQLAPGVKASKLTALARDLARSLSVTSVRVVEIIPGKTVVGIELPNQDRATVQLSSVLSSKKYASAVSPLSLCLGVDIAGEPMVVNLAKMPHLLVAGTTGSGKSVGINAMILSLLFKATPDEVRLILVDPKMLELSVYDDIPHLLTPVVTDMKEAASALRWCVGEMERRYRLMAALGVRNIAGYNQKVTDAINTNSPIVDPLWKMTDSMDEKAPLLETLPYIVVIIDELADMMMVVGKKVEQLIARIAQKARAAGIHLILATQRPSVDVLTGLIKSNIPTRISFQVSSKIDSRTILDQQGAEQLLGHGDMLLLSPGAGTPLRVHGAFVGDDEVHRVADNARSQGKPDYIDEITQLSTESFEDPLSEEEATEQSDALYDGAVEFVLQTRKASISSVQRRFKIGYNRAARLVEEMERNGLVGPLEGGAREVLVNTVEK